MNKSLYVKNYFLPVTSAIMCSLMQITELPIVASFCFVPLFFSVESKEHISGKLTAFFLTYHAILNAYLLTLYDALNISVIAGILLCLLCLSLLSVYQTAVMLLCTAPSLVLKKRELALVAFCFCYPFGQLLLERIPVIGYPWARIELSLTPVPELLSTAGIFGGNFTALLILLVNSFVYLLVRSVSEGSVRKTASCCSLISLLLFSSLLYGKINTAKKTTEDFLKVLVIQGEVEGTDKLSVSKEQAVDWYCDYLSKFSDEQYDIVLLPETAVPSVLDKDSEERLTEQLNADTTVLLGCILEEDENRYNALKVAGEESFRLKEILVPFGEYTPFFEIEGMPNLKASEEGTTLSFDNYICGALICIESIYPHLLLPQIKDGAQIVLVSTNDSWFKNSYARQMHFRHSIIRACEFDRCVIRSANCGISAVIDRNGNIRAIETSKQAAHLKAYAELVTTKTPYARFGELPMLLPFVYVVCFYIRMLSRKVLPCIRRKV